MYMMKYFVAIKIVLLKTVNIYKMFVIYSNVKKNFKKTIKSRVFL